MSRVTLAEHYRRHQFVRMLFDETKLQVLFALVDPGKQYELHDYYATDKDFDEGEYEAYRRDRDLVDPSLANRAGKHFKAVEDAFIEASRRLGVTDEQRRRAVEASGVQSQYVAQRSHSNSRTPGRPARNRNFSIVAIAKPTPDFQKLARALIAEARELQRAASSSSSDQPRTVDPAGSVTTLPRRVRRLPKAAQG